MFNILIIVYSRSGYNILPPL